jgi:hypothetical protein
MKLSELIETLTEMADGLGDDAEVALAIQPNWPFEHYIGEVVEVDGTVYISEAGQSGYLAGEVSRELGWK